MYPISLEELALMSPLTMDPNKMERWNWLSWELVNFLSLGIS